MKRKGFFVILIGLLIITGAISGCGENVATKTSSKDIATIQRIHASVLFYKIFVDLKPTDISVANKSYTVDLYEKGKLRATTDVSWNEYETNVFTVKSVTFPSTYEECTAYYMKDISGIFTAKVHE